MQQTIFEGWKMIQRISMDDLVVENLAIISTIDCRCPLSTIEFPPKQLTATIFRVSLKIVHKSKASKKFNTWNEITKIVESELVMIINLYLLTIWTMCATTLDKEKWALAEVWVHISVSVCVHFGCISYKKVIFLVCA